MSKSTEPAAASAAEVAVVVEPTGAIAFVSEARAVELEQAGQGRRARPIDLEVAGVAPRA